MTELWSLNEINEFDNLFRTCQSFVGKKIDQVVFYLDKEDTNFSEQENIYGKSLLNSIELVICGETFCVGNLFFKKSYNGLNILPGRTTDYENVNGKEAIFYPSEIVGRSIVSVVIYWVKSHWGKYFVPQEIEFNTDANIFLCSAIEINDGQVNTPLTDELLVVEDEFTSQKFQLGKYGVKTNGRYVFNNLNELMNSERNIG